MSDSDIVQEFLVESSENLDRLDTELVVLEKNPQASDVLASVFRTIHTIKGTCGFLGFTKLEKLTHVGENLLSRLRDRQLTLNPEITTALLSMVDAVRQMLGEIRATGQDGQDDYSALIQTLAGLQQAPNSSPPAAVVPAPQAPRILECTAPEQSPAPEPAQAEAKAEGQAPHPPVPSKIGGVLVERGMVKPEDLARALGEQEKGDPRAVGEILIAQGTAKPEDVLAAQHILETRLHDGSAETVRVGVNLLDKLMTNVGELVLARNQLLQVSSAIHDTRFQAISQPHEPDRVGIAGRSDEDAHATHRQHLEQIPANRPRCRAGLRQKGCASRWRARRRNWTRPSSKPSKIRSRTCCVMRSIMASNCPRPGSGQARTRWAASCSAPSTRGGQVNIEINDDGAGLSRERIRDKAIERGLLSADQAARLPEHDILNLIFLPGFSTAEKVTKVSGRGVGMDVVKTNVEKIGGTVDLQSTPGQGTTVRVKVPLTLAIIPALVVTSGRERFAIPQVNLTELVRLEGEGNASGIETVHGAPVYRLRGRLLPLVYLNREIGLQEPSPGTQAGAQPINIVVLQADGREFGLVVDQINDTEEIVVKPLRKQLKSIRTFAGASIMGDGKVALILDVTGLAQRAKVITEVRDRTLNDKDSVPQGSDPRQTFLLFEGPDRGRMAVPLDTLARLEELPASQVERSGSQWVAQYRGQILPLINLASALEERRGKRRGTKTVAPETPSLQVLVCNHAEQRVGVIVERILDIVEDSAGVQLAASRSGVLYSAVIQGLVTELIDIPAVLRAAGLDPATPKNPVEGMTHGV